MSETLTDVLAAAARSPRGVHFLDREERAETLSYAQILSRARAVAGGLAGTGVRPGDRVALVLPTSPDFPDAFFGALLAGAVPVPLYPPVRLGRLDEFHDRTAAMLRASGARLVLTDRRIRRLLGESVERARPELGCTAVSALPQGDAPSCPRRPDDLAFVQFSSGTTRDPKPVALTHAQVLANVRAILGAILRAHPETAGLRHICVSWLPLYHDMGLVGALLSALAHPGDLVLIPPEVFVARPAVWLRALSRYRGTISPAPNFAYALCADRVRDEEMAGVDLSRWRVALNGAEPVTPRVLGRFLARFGPLGFAPRALTPVYGLAEAALAVTFSDVERSFRWERFDREALAERGVARPGGSGEALVSVGRPLPGFALRIVGEKGGELGAGRLGRVHVRGPSVMQGYLGLPEATREVLADGWLDTGDTGFLHEGELYLYGRAKDLVVIRGRNHAPQEVEQAADEVAGVRVGCCAAVGVVAHEGDGEALVVFVERGQGADAADDADLAVRVRGRVAARTGLVPAEVVVLSPGTLPRTSSGKIRRAEAARRHREGRLLSPADVTPLRLARALLRSSLGFARARRAS